MSSIDSSALFQAETLTLINELSEQSSLDDIVGTVSKLRAGGHPQERIHHAIEQVRLRRKAGVKFGQFASSMLFTEAGLEQATRLGVAAHHAGRFQAAGLQSVADLGCGIGGDSMAFAALGLHVLAVDADPLTAAVASFNLASFDNAEVENTTLESIDLSRVESAWLDPARRDGVSRLTNPDDWSPSLDVAFDIARTLPSGVKLAPGMDRSLIPDDMEAQWVSAGGDVVEMVLWSGVLKTPEVTRSALIIGPESSHTLSAAGDTDDVTTGELGEYLYEPDGAIIRARLIGDVARSVEGRMIDSSIAYFTADSHHPTPFASAFRVEEVLSPKTKDLAKWVRDNEVGTLEIKKRGFDVDPATLRKQLPLSGSTSKTLILTRANGKKVAIAATRINS